MTGAARYAAIARSVSDDELAAAVAANRGAILETIFAAMPAQLDADAAAGHDFVVEWRITGAPDGGWDRWQVAVRDGRCTVTRDGEAEPAAVLTAGPVEFTRLVSGAATGPSLFMYGGLQVEGDLLVASRLNSMFRIPEATG